MKPSKIKLLRKDELQLGAAGDLYIFAEGDGMCQKGAVTIFQIDECDSIGQIRFHKSNIPRIIKALQSKLPTMTEENNDDFNDEINKIKGDAW